MEVWTLARTAPGSLSFNVLSLGYGLKMPRIDAPLVTADVVDLFVMDFCAIAKEFESESVNQAISFAYPHFTIRLLPTVAPFQRQQRLWSSICTRASILWDVIGLVVVWWKLSFELREFHCCPVMRSSAMDYAFNDRDLRVKEGKYSVKTLRFSV